MKIIEKFNVSLVIFIVLGALSCKKDESKPEVYPDFATIEEQISYKPWRIKRYEICTDYFSIKDTSFIKTECQDDTSKSAKYFIDGIVRYFYPKDSFVELLYNEWDGNDKRWKFFDYRFRGEKLYLGIKDDGYSSIAFMLKELVKLTNNEMILLNPSSFLKFNDSTICKKHLKEHLYR